MGGMPTPLELVESRAEHGRGSWELPPGFGKLGMKCLDAFEHMGMAAVSGALVKEELQIATSHQKKCLAIAGVYLHFDPGLPVSENEASNEPSLHGLRSLSDVWQAK